MSRETLLQKIAQAIDSQERFIELRNFIFDYYAAEDEYDFTSPELEKVFAVLLPYLHFEEAFGDPQRPERLRLLEKTLKEEMSPEAAILGLEFDKISQLLQKLRSGLISDTVFETQLKKISPVDLDWDKVLDLYQAHPEFR